MGSCRRRFSSVRTACAFACHLLRIVCCNTVNHPWLVFPQMCVKPRKLKLSDFPSPRSRRDLSAKRPNSMSRVLSGCSPRPNFANRSRRSVRNRRLFTMLEPNHEVVAESHDDHVTMCMLLSPLLGPQVEHIVQVDLSQYRRNAAALDRTDLAVHSLPILQHASVQPFLDESHDALVPDSVLDKLHQPFMDKGSKEVPNVGVEHPVHLLFRDADRGRVQRLVRAASRSEPIRKAEKIRFIDGAAHLSHRALDDLVLQCRHSERPKPPVCFRYVRSANRLCPVRSSRQPRREVLEVGLQVLAVVPPRLAVYAGGCVSL